MLPGVLYLEEILRDLYLLCDSKMLLWLSFLQKEICYAKNILLQMTSLTKKTKCRNQQQYITQKRESWKTLCSSIDARAPNSKLCRIAKSFSNDQHQGKNSNIVLDFLGQVLQDNKDAANIVGKLYKTLVF
ncbi:hypothetical protein TNCT_136291 [Trichonephila clavata]|uniref:Uncharacterized protein n=1 Tax=Trichonephila clavata TaxID=2740835 RepID=A0A8X6JFS9_TRICU|nr:hypothetical protein TNCT_136291 [Trichonephila clavata]